MRAQSVFDRCPAANYCALTAPILQAPECGSVPEHVSSLSMAENLCGRALRGYVQLEQVTPAYEDSSDLDEPTQPIKKELRLAWAELESAAMPKIDEGKAGSYFEAAHSRAETVLGASNATFSLKMDAALLKGYLPLFRTRRSGEPVSMEQFQRARSVINIIYQALLTAEVHKNATHPNHLESPGHKACLPGEYDRTGFSMKLAGYMMAAKAGILLYPASHREAYLVGDENLAFHHDAYAIDGSTKLPLKFRLKQANNTGRKTKYGESIHYVSMRTLLAETVSNLGMHRMSQEEKELLPGQLSWWLHTESTGGTNPAYGQKIADHITKLFVVRLEQFRRQYYMPDSRIPPIWQFDPRTIQPVPAIPSAPKKPAIIPAAATAPEPVRMPPPEPLKEPETAYVPEEQQDDSEIDTATGIKTEIINDVHWTLVPPGLKDLHTNDRLAKIDTRKIAMLQELATEWSQDSYLAFAGLKPSGTYELAVAVLPEVVDGIKVEHAVVEYANGRNFVYVYRGEKGISNGFVVTNWQYVFSSTKAEAQKDGAKQIARSADSAEDVLEYITEPN